MKPKPVGIVITLTGNLLFGWGLYNLMSIGSCGGYYAPCPSDSWPFFVAVPVGILLSMIAIFAGGGGFAFLGIFATVGITSILTGFEGGVGGEGSDGGDVFAFVFGGFFLIPVLLPLLLIPLGRRKLRRAERLVEDGDRGVATVLAVHDTGVTVNGNPRVKLTLRIEPEDGSPAIQRHKTITASRVDIPRPGDAYPVWYDPKDPKATGLGIDVEPAAPPGVRALFEKARRAEAAQEIRGTITPVPVPASPPASPPAPAPVAQDWVTELARLNDLRLAGALTDEEFTRAKEKLLAGSPPAPAGG